MTQKARAASGTQTGVSGARLAAALACCVLALACGTGSSEPGGRRNKRAEARAEEQRNERLQREVERLRADLKQAEDVLLGNQNGNDAGVSRANAVSALAEASIRLERAATRAPWRRPELGEARGRLEEADRQLQAGHAGAAAFFASRAARMADSLIREANSAVRTKNTLWVNAPRLNVRDGPSTGHRVLAVLPRNAPVFEEKVDGNWALVRTPSGVLGWVYRPMLEAL